MRVVRATPTSQPTAYQCEQALLPRLTRPDGSTLTPQRFYTLAPIAADPNDPVALTSVFFTRPASSETLTLRVGTRNAHPHGLLFTGDGFVNVPIIAFIDGVAASEFKFQREGEADAYYDNPTMQGALLTTIAIVDSDGEAVIEHPEVFCPAPVLYLALHSGANGTGYYRGATRPLHYDAGGRQQAPGFEGIADHGERIDQIAVAWDEKEYQEIVGHIGNRARVHSFTAWAFQRRPRTILETTPFRNTFGAGATIVERPLGDKFDTLEVFDLDDLAGVVYDKSSVLGAFATSGPGATTPNNTIGFIEFGNRFFTENMSTGEVLAAETQAFATQRGCIAVTDSNSGLCVAIIAKLNNDASPFDGCRTPNSVQINFPCFDTYDAYTHPQVFDHLGPYLQLNTYDQSERAAGWIGCRYLVYIGHRDHLLAALNDIANTELLEEDVPEPPAEVLDGTEWPPGTSAGSFLVDAFYDGYDLARTKMPTTSLSGVHEGVVAQGSGAGNRKHKTVLRSLQTSIASLRPIGGASSAAVTTYTSLALAGNRMNPPSTLVAQIIQASAVTGTVRLKVKGFDQFGDRITEETPSVDLVAKTNNFIYLAKVFAWVDSLEFQSTGLDIAGDTISLGTRWDWTRTVDTTNAHTNGLNLGFGLPVRVGAQANTSLTVRVPRSTSPVPVKAYATLSVPTNPADGHTVTIDGKAYTFQAILTNVDGNVLIGASAAASVFNLYRAINLLDGAGTAYAALMAIHTTVSVLTVPTSTDLVVTAKVPGVLGNLIAVSETLTGSSNVWSGSYLEGGESDTREVRRITVRDISGRGSNATNPPVTAVDGRRILLGYADTGYERVPEKASILKQDAAPQWGTKAAVQDLTIQTNPGNGHTVTIDGKVYTFQTVLTNVDGNVFIGASAAASLENLRRAINLMSGAGTNYATAMTLHSTVFAYPTRSGSGLSGVLRVQAKTTGTAGNSLAVSEALSGTGNAWGDTTLLGGLDTLIDVMVEMDLHSEDRPYSET